MAIKRTLHNVGKENCYVLERQVWPSLISYMFLPVNLSGKTFQKRPNLSFI